MNHLFLPLLLLRTAITNGHLETNSRISLHQKARSKPAKEQFCKIHARHQSDKLADFYPLPPYSCL